MVRPLPHRNLIGANSDRASLGTLLGKVVPGGSFRWQALTLIGGTVTGQAMLIVTAPLLTRLYGPTDFAVYALFAVGANVLGGVAAGRFDWALMLPDEDEDAATLLVVGVTLATLVALVTLAILAISSSSILALFNLGDDEQWIWLVPLGVALTAWGGIVTRWQARKKRFRTLAKAEAGAAIATVSSQIFAALLLTQTTGFLLISGYLVGRSLSLGIISREPLLDVLRYRSGISRSRMLLLTQRYRRFLLVSVPTSLLGKVHHEIPRITLGAFFGPIVLGYFTLTMRVLKTPASMVGSAVGQVFFPRISECQHDGKGARTLIVDTACALFLLIAGPMLLLFFFAEPLFGFVFGVEWVTAGQYARLLIPMLAAQFVIAPIGLALQAFEKHRLVLIWQAIFLCLTVGAFALGSYFDSVELGLLVYALSSTLMYLIYFYFSVRFAIDRHTA